MHLYKQGKRWNDWNGNARFRSICSKVQESAVTSPDGFDEILEYLNIKCPDIGDKITVREVKDYVRHDTPYWRDTDRIVKSFGSVIYTFGFERVKMKSNGNSTWGYRRVKAKTDE